MFVNNSQLVNQFEYIYKYIYIYEEEVNNHLRFNIFMVI